jgi:hypothetical protein
MPRLKWGQISNGTPLLVAWSPARGLLLGAKDLIVRR